VKYLVTGGAGFIGSALVNRLAADGHEVRVLDNFSRGKLGRLTGTFELLPGDVRDADFVRDMMFGCDTVIHLAYLQGTQTFYEEPRQVLDVAVRGIISVLGGCEQAGVRDLMLVSSAEAYEVEPAGATPETVPLCVPDPLNPRYSYGGGKIISELMSVAWQRTGVLDRLVIVRPHNIIGPDMGTKHVVPEFALRMNELTRLAPEGVIGFPIQGTGQETRSFCYIDDCVDQFCLLLDAAPQGAGIYHAGAMDERTIYSVAHEVAACYGRPVKVIPGTRPAGSPLRRLPDTAKITALGYGGPKVPFAEAIARTVAWYRQAG
jgi:dTDP-glucose 4,6-dehydratase/UDP-glucose 4-epimerase